MEENMNVNPEELEPVVITLVDEETSEEQNFEIIADGMIDGKTYYALVPADDEESEEYIILRYREGENDDVIFETVDDDEEFEKVEDYFNDLFFSEVDYDQQ